MAATIDFRLLGSVAVWCDGQVVPLRRAKERTLLAALLLNAGRTVSAATLMEVLWGAELPASAAASLQTHMMRLRRSLGEVIRSRISTCPAGYEMAVSAGELDVGRVDGLLRSGRAAVRDQLWERAAELSATALGEWRGEPLADVSSELLALQEVPRLSEMKLQLWEMHAEAAMMLGRHAELIGELQRLAAVYPLREHLHALLMQVLYRYGRQADAVACYQDIRHVLIDELGIEPGTELVSVHQRILAGDAVRTSAVAVPRPRPALAGSRAVPVPRQLPSAVRRFTGRDAELAVLTGLLDQLAAETPGTVLISAIGGTAGVGKTALAVQWSHQVTPYFPDGQLYVDLCGYGPQQPMPPGEALSGFLRALGVIGRNIPADVAERAALYRTLLSGRRMLVLLDNARAAWQVRPLLPGCATCLTVVTSRDALAGLVARDGAQRMDLDLLPLADAVRLLCTLIGERAAADPDATRALAEACCRLPLVLRVAAELAAARPASTLRDLGVELAGRRRAGAADDPVSDMRVVFSWSYQRLTGGSARAFRLAGLAPGRWLDEYVLAALLDVAPARAGQLLDELARAHLLQPAGPGRYTMHDLLRGYARELARAHEAETGRRAAVTRLLDYYLKTVAAAMAILYPGGAYSGHAHPGGVYSGGAYGGAYSGAAYSGGAAAESPPSERRGPLFDSRAAARSWLDDEREVLVAVTGYAAENGWPDHATGLSAALVRYLVEAACFPEARTIHRYARLAAASSGDALCIYERLGVPEASRVCARLNQCASGRPR